MKNDGGPAFPTTEEQYSGMDGRWANITQGGMTLRTYLAGQAMMGLASHQELYDYKLMAQDALSLADALLAELAKEE